MEFEEPVENLNVIVWLIEPIKVLFRIIEIDL